MQIPSEEDKSANADNNKDGEQSEIGQQVPQVISCNNVSSCHS